MPESNPYYSPPLLAPHTKTAGEDLISGFAESTLWSIPRFFGIKPPIKVQEFDVEHPWLAFGADVLGTSIPYAGWYKASKNLKKFDELVKGLGDAEKAPFLTGAVQTAARFAPLEASRVGFNAVFGDTPNADMIASAAINELLAGGIGGGIELLKAGGRAAAKLAPTIQEDNTNLAMPLRLRSIDEKLASGAFDADPEQKLKVMNVYNSMKKLSRAETLNLSRARYVSALKTPDSQDDVKYLNRLFDTTNDDSKALWDRRMLVESKRGGFTTEAGVEAVVRRGELPANFENLGQYYRHVSFKNSEGAEKIAERVNNTINRSLQQVGKGWYIGQEPGDGLYVMARKLNGAYHEGSVDDQWLMFKTDQPDAFAKGAGKWTKSNAEAGAWAREDVGLNKDFGDLGNSITQFKKDYPYATHALLGQKGLGKFWTRLQEITGIKANTVESNQLLKNFHDFFRAHFTPTPYQTKNPLAVHILGTARAAAGAATRLKDSILFGEYKIKPGTNLIYESLKGAKSIESDIGLKHQLDNLKDNEIEQLWKLNKTRAGPQEVLEAFAQGNISEPTMKVAIAMLDHDSRLFDMGNKVRKATGHGEMGPTKDRMLVAPKWEGDSRILLRDQGGAVRYMAAGFNKRQAEQAAQEVLAKNPNWIKAEEFQISNAANLPKDIRIYARDERALMQRKNIGGYKFDDKPWTRKELMEVIEQNVTHRVNQQAEMTARYALEEDMMKLNKESPADFNIAATRMNDFFGHQRPVAVWINKLSDQVLGPVMGPNSASEIVQATNTGMWHFTLGAGNIGNVVMNLLNPVQTVMPELAMLLNGVPARLAPYYSHFAAGGTKGPVGIVHMFDPLKIMRQGIKEMRKPSEDLLKIFERAGNERLISPQIAEGFMGESASTVADMRKALSSPGGFAHWLRALSEWLPATSERFARSQSLTTGYIFGRDFLGLRDDALYQFVKDFNHKTMYGYTAADRPGVFNGPAGTALGLFKNWMTHYLFSMMQYTSEASRGNWTPLLWQQAATWSVGGLAAMPLAVPIASQFSEAVSNKSIIENTYEHFSQGTADGIFYGLPAVMTGLSLSSQASSPLANPARDAEMLFSFATFDRLKFMGQAVGAAMDNWSATGEHPGKSDQVKNLLVRALAPKTLYKLFSAAQTEGIQSLSTGNPILSDASPYDKIAFGLGIGPVELERTYAASNILWKEKTAHDAKVAQLGQAYAEAMQRQDSDTMMLVLKNATALGITSSVLNSARRRHHSNNTDLIERNFGADALIRFKNLLD